MLEKPPEDKKEILPTPLTDYALARLRELVSGNGVEPAKIQLKNTDERQITLTGTMRLVPKVEVKEQKLTGKGIKLPAVEKSFISFAELSSHVAEVEKNYLESKDWFGEVKEDLEKLPGKGWGLEQARIVLDNKPAQHFSASETCTVCFGNGSLTCEYCVGKGYTPCRICYERGIEQCYNCYGRGTDPQDADKPCYICNGRRVITCRTCQGRKGIPCGTCQGSGLMVCQPCQGGGRLVRLITMEYGAEATFASGGGADMPSALRRALDRSGGLKMLAGGHARIESTVPKEEEQRPGQSVINYTAKLTCADAVIQFGDEAKRIAVFGDKRTMLEVPAFLDKALAPGIELLGEVAKGQVRLEKALEYRAIADACRLVLNGQGKLMNLRKLYPIGLSKDAIIQLLRGVRRALARVTMGARWVGFIAAFVVADVLGGALYMTPLHQTILQSGGGQAALAVEFALPLFCAMLGYILTGQAALFHLHRQFPQARLKLHHHGGILGAMAALIAFLIPFGIGLLYPVDVQWLQLIKS